jgi:tRNA (guanine-N7-)-methyltransferase
MQPMIKPRSIYADKLRDFPEVALVDQAAFKNRGRWDSLFRKRIGSTFDGRVIFEIGCADAGYLTRIAANHPTCGFVGLDWKYKALLDGAQRVTESGIRNVLLLRGRAQDVLKIFGEQEVDEIWIFHPDPCDRPIELKNRLVSESFLNDAHAVLRDHTSIISLKTDHPGYYQWVLGLFGLPEPEWFQHPESPPTAPRVRRSDLMRPADVPGPSEKLRSLFKVTSRSADFWNDPAVLSHTSARYFAGETTTFESRFIKKRLPIYYFEMTKR